MKRAILFLSVLACAGSLLAVTKKDTIRRTFTVGSTDNRVEVDSVFGSITVTAHSGQTVEMVANQKFEADDDAALQNALRDVKLDLTQTGNTVRIYVDGPFRDHDRRGWREDPRYRPIYDFELRVPIDTSLRLRTVTEGSISVIGVRGVFDVSNVNGRVDMKDIGGSGSAVTVNGPVHASFRQLPDGALKFKTVNGEVEISFPGGLNADAHAKTMNGDLYTDFEVTQLANKPVALEAHGSRRSWRADHGGNIRVGAGGPDLSLETLNGDIRILKH